MQKLNTDIVLYDDSNELEFATNHPYWLAINGYFIKLSKTNYTELASMLNPKPKLSDSEKLILSTIDPKYKWIAKDDDNSLYVYVEEPMYSEMLAQFMSPTDPKECEPLNIFNNLFIGIKPTKKYKIQNLIESR